MMCATWWVQDYVVHHRAELCTTELHCAPYCVVSLSGRNLSKQLLIALAHMESLLCSKLFLIFVNYTCTGASEWHLAE